MREAERWIGSAVAKGWWDVAAAGEERPWRVANDEAGIAALVETLAARAPQLIVLEATGGVARAVAAALLAVRLPVAVVNPTRVRAVATASGQHAKTDTLHARVLAQFAQRRQPPLRQVPAAITEERRGVLGRRRQLVAMPTAEENRRATVPARLRPQLAAHLALLAAQVSERDAALAQTIADSPAWRVKEALLGTIPGIGAVVARTLLAQMPELGTRSRQEAAARAGVAPLNRDSGRTVRHRSIGGGRSGVRAMVSMAAMTAARCEPTMHAFHERLEQHGKPGKVILVACMRTLLSIANAVLRDGVPWQARGSAMA